MSGNWTLPFLMLVEEDCKHANLMLYCKARDSELTLIYLVINVLCPRTNSHQKEE